MSKMGTKYKYLINFTSIFKTLIGGSAVEMAERMNVFRTFNSKNTALVTPRDSRAVAPNPERSGHAAYGLLFLYIDY